MSATSDYPYDLSGYARDDSKSIWETRGLTWQYAYNHEEAAKCYQKAICEDGGNLFAMWGLAYSLGPNYNKDWSMFEDEEKNICYNKSRMLLTKGITAAKGREDELGAQLLNALEKKYPTEGSDYSDATHRCYVDAMKELYEKRPTDLDVAAIYAEAIMGLKPWGLWTRSGEPAIPEALTAQIVLEKAISSGIQHPGTYHFYIHLMELSGTPDKSLDVCNKLEVLVPDAGHLIHMPSHIYIQLGMYKESLRSNNNAIKADMKAYANRAEQGDHFYTLYRFHDYHFASWAGMFLGNYEAALKPAMAMFETLDFEVLKSKWFDPLLETERGSLGDWFEAFLATYIHVKVRFGKWDELINDNHVATISSEHDPDTTIFTTLRATLSYAQCVAYAAKSGQVSSSDEKSDLLKKSEEKLAEFESKMKILSETTPDRMVMNNSAISILNVGRFIARGELQFRQGKVKEAIENLQTAVRLFDGGDVEDKGGIVYDEPWGWMMPARHPLGALALEANLVDIATEAFEQDLGIQKGPHQSYPDNIWSLLGLRDCYTHLGKDTTHLNAKIETAQKHTDTTIKASCFCHRDAF